MLAFAVFGPVQLGLGQWLQVVQVLPPFQVYTIRGGRICTLQQPHRCRSSSQSPMAWLPAVSLVRAWGLPFSHCPAFSLLNPSKVVADVAQCPLNGPCVLSSGRSSVNTPHLLLFASIHLNILSVGYDCVVCSFTFHALRQTCREV